MDTDTCTCHETPGNGFFICSSCLAEYDAMVHKVYPCGCVDYAIILNNGTHAARFSTQTRNCLRCQQALAKLDAKEG